jgi:uncharacterized membrane protein (UPF0127 family)
MAPSTRALRALDITQNSTLAVLLKFVPTRGERTLMSATKLATVLLLCVFASSCGNGDRASVAQAASSAPAPGPQFCHAIPLGATFCSAMTIEAPKGTLRLAVADTPARREKGLMGVREVPANEGMIFVFPDRTDVTRAFWMKDTVTPLDMVFVNTDGIITEIAERVAATKPGTPDSRVARREGIGRYVIELQADRAEALGLQPGTRLLIPPLSAQ